MNMMVSDGDGGALPFTSYSEWSDRELVESLSEQCDGAYAELFRRHSQSVGWVAERILGGQHGRCEDVVHEVFVGLWLSPETFDPARGTVLGFLRLKARGRSIDIVRSDVRRHRREECSGGTPSPEQQPGIDHEVFRSESVREVQEALSLLPRSESELIYLAFFKGMTYLGVATQLGLPLGTVKSRIRHGLFRLRSSDTLQAYFEDRAA